ncbi:GTP pyrophosphokinase [Nocardia sp. NPDC055029]
MPIADNSGDFDTATESLESFGISLERLISELLNRAGIQVHSVTYRVKTKESADKKIANREGKYSSVAELTDLLGIRVITYFTDEVDRVANALIPEFAIDPENSVDKRKILDPDRFGYLSLHYIAKLGETRETLVEYERFKGRVFEIQIRSILQHAWAEIEHDLGYKANGSLPTEMKRKFSRLAGLLEMADDEFVNIRDTLGTLEEQVAEEIEADSSNSTDTEPPIEIDQLSVRAMLRTAFLRELDTRVAQAINAPLDSRIEGRYISRRVAEIESFGVSDIATVIETLSAYREQIVEFAKLWSAQKSRRRGEPRPAPRGISVFFLQTCLVGQAYSSRKQGDSPLALNAYGPELPKYWAEIWREVVENVGEPSGLAGD